MGSLILMRIRSLQDQQCPIFQFGPFCPFKLRPIDAKVAYEFVGNSMEHAELFMMIDEGKTREHQSHI
jgi:hypothetical protein